MNDLLLNCLRWHLINVALMESVAGLLWPTAKFARLSQLGHFKSN